MQYCSTCTTDFAITELLTLDEVEFPCPIALNYYLVPQNFGMAAPPFDLSDASWGKVHPGMWGKLEHELVLIRHAESKSNRKLMTEERDHDDYTRDVDLTELGERQAARVHAIIDKLQPCCVYSSPLKRAYKTAGKPNIVDASLRELNVDESFMTEQGLLASKETTECFKDRVGYHIERWRARGKHKPVRSVVVSHSLFISEVLNQLYGGEGAFMHLGNASITVVHFTDGDQVEIQMVGSVDHLPVDERSGHHTALHYHE
jgi:broad specificity phosphatase PhoE